jgi:ribonucleoside-triphosphate reductase (formate)
LDKLKVIDDYLDDAWWTKENANIDKSVMAMNNRLAEQDVKQWWLSRIYTDKIRNAYSNGLFHIHNLGHLTTYCVGWNLEDLQKIGFKGAPGKQTSGPAKHFRSMLGQIYNFMFTLQGEAAGAQAFSNFDSYLAPFVSYDGLSQDDVDQGIQEFLFNMNVATRVGGQPPFTNITLDQTIPKFMEDDYTIRGGEYTDDTYGSFDKEISMINEAWWKARIKGDFVGRVQPFPIETLNVTKDFDWEDELLFKAVALRGTPYFSNFINSDMNPEDVRSMCCRLRIDNTVLNKRGGGFFGASPLTGSVGVVTLNMPMIAYNTKDEDRFLETIDHGMELAMESLQLKRAVLERMTTNNMYPYSKVYLDSVYQRFGKYWENHFSTIGLVGMNEACLNLIDEDIASSSGLDLAVRTLDFMRDKALELQDKTNAMVNIEATPAEGTAYRLAMNDRKTYGRDLITAGTRDTPYYTNSTHLPVDTDEGLGFYLNHQDKLQPKYTGGTVFHIWNGEVVPQWEAVSNLVRRVATNYSLNYFTYSPTTSVCPTHGFLSGEQPICPKCGSECEVWQRVTGFFAPVKQWNAGKKQEFQERHHFTVMP